MGKNSFNISDLLGMGTPTTKQWSWEVTKKDVYDLLPSKDNFYSTNQIEHTAISIRALGILQPLTIRRLENGKDEIISGHRRRLASIKNVEDGFGWCRYVPCVYREDAENKGEIGEMETPELKEIINRMNIKAANDFRDMTDWDRMQEALGWKRDAEELRKIFDIKGQTRKIVEELTGGKIKGTQMARYLAVNNKLIPELQAELKEGRINISVAYEASTLKKEYQKQALEIFMDNDVLTLEDIRILKEWQEEPEEPEGIEELERAEESESPLGQQEQKENNEDTESANRQQEQPESRQQEKTEEQKYNEEQDTIDRKTAKLLEQREDKEKMERLPSDVEKKQKEIAVPTSIYEEILHKGLDFLLIKKDGYKKGEIVLLQEMKDGGRKRTSEIEITHILQDRTGIEDNYCIIGFNIKDNT